MDCSPTNRERELGLDRRETGWFYPTDGIGRCDSNPAQYERNRRFGHLVHALGRSAGGAKLPSAGLCLNASKAASHLDDATILLHSVCHEAETRPLTVGKLC